MPMTEDAFLQQKAEEARRGIADSIARAKSALVDKADPRPLARKHPIIALASATITGFVAAAVAVPSREELALRRMERLQRAMHPQPEPPPAAANGKASEHPHTEKPTIWATLLHEAIQLIKPILIAAITAGVKSATTPPDEDQRPL